jgi:hypothetical protein
MYEPEPNMARHVYNGVELGSEVDKVVHLEERKFELEAYYADVLPDLVLDTHYFIARGDDDEPHIYEVQRKLDAYVNPTNNSMFPSTPGGNKLAQYIETLSAEERTVLASEIHSFVTRTQELIKDTDHESYAEMMPDLHANNIALTKAGHVRLYDFNILRDKSAAPAGASINFALNTLGRIADMLTNYDQTNS